MEGFAVGCKLESVDEAYSNKITVYVTNPSVAIDAYKSISITYGGNTLQSCPTFIGVPHDGSNNTFKVIKIGMGVYHRKFLLMSNPEETVQYKLHPSQPPAAVLIRGKLSLFSRREVALDEDAIHAYLKKMCKNLVVTVNAGLIIKLNINRMDVPFVFIPTSATIYDSDEVTSAEYATITDITKYEVELDTQHEFAKLINFTKSKRSQTSFMRSKWDFQSMGIGGLDKELTAIFRRGFTSRLLPPEFTKETGGRHVKGMLLYGPPGTGKTLIARQIAKMLNSVEPKIVNGPELFNKFVGQSEENMRKLFEPAEQDYAENGDNAELHVIIFDEIDALCRARGSGRSSTGTNDNMVNQLLTKLDGVDSCPNVLVMGMTNRKDLLDPALLRPGRMEIQLEIPLPDLEGRVQILKIHTATLSKNSRLADDVDLQEIASKARNFSGAELAGLVAAALSLATMTVFASGDNNYMNIDPKAIANIKVSRQNFIDAFADIKPVYGVEIERIESLIDLECVEKLKSAADMARSRIVQAIETELAKRYTGSTSHHIIVVHGYPSSPVPDLAAQAALEVDIPLIKLIDARFLRGPTVSDKISDIDTTVSQAFDSKTSLIIINEIEDLLEWTEINSNFSAAMLHKLSQTLKLTHPRRTEGFKLITIVTSRDFDLLSRLNVVNLDRCVVINIDNTI